MTDATERTWGLSEGTKIKWVRAALDATFHADDMDGFSDAEAAAFIDALGATPYIIVKRRTGGQE